MTDVTFQVGTDIGGTFTDLWIHSSEGLMRVFKCPTTPDAISGVFSALQLAADELGMNMADLCSRITRFGHGTTRGLNALLTGNTARTAILTTWGFGDTLEIGRLKQQHTGLNEIEVSDLYLRHQRQRLVPRTQVYEVTERINRNGEVVQPLDLEQAEATIASLDGDAIQAVAICTLWATQNPAHEIELRRLCQEKHGDRFVSVSHEVAPQVGEYGRMMTTAANAALGPVMSSYFKRLESSLKQARVEAPLLAMTSVGGVSPAQTLSDIPVAALFSGPAAGVMGCQAVGAMLGMNNIIVMDVGGTSFDVALVVEGSPIIRSNTTVGDIDIQFPSIEILSIGAGGGSIAGVFHGRLLVGPQSAGAEPGPACYDRGGQHPTMTDADLVLGVLDPENFIGGRMKLNADAARRALREYVAGPLGLSVEEAALGIRMVQDSKMADLIRRLTIERGYDPKDFVMFACGGSGPSHAWALCRELGIEKCVVPANASGQSAYGTGTCDIKQTSEKTVYTRIPPGQEPSREQVDRVIEVVRQTEQTVRALLNESAPDAEIHIGFTAAIRYRGQSHHLDVDIAPDTLANGDIGSVLTTFEQKYEGLYGKGSAFREAGFEILYVRAIGTAKLTPFERFSGGRPLRAAGSRPVVYENADQPVETAIWTTDHPPPGQQLTGPAIIELPGATVVIPRGATASIDRYGNIVMEFEQ